MVVLRYIFVNEYTLTLYNFVGVIPNRVISDI